MSKNTEPWKPLKRYPNPPGGGGGSAEGDSSGEGGEAAGPSGHSDADGDQHSGAGPSSRTRSKSTTAGGKGGGTVPVADVRGHPDQRSDLPEGLLAAMATQAAAIDQGLVEDIAGSGSTGYVFTVKWVSCWRLHTCMAADEQASYAPASLHDASTT
jgi:hypothetical protein